MLKRGYVEKLEEAKRSLQDKDNELQQLKEQLKTKEDHGMLTC